MAGVRHCSDHDFFAGIACPECGERGDRVLRGDHRERLSKFLSGLLRHFPGEYGVDLDAAGWADWSEVVAVASDRYGWADERAVAGVVATDPKGRFERRAASAAERASSVNRERDDGRVRAAYGHSIAVDLDAEPGDVPDTLYHATAPRNLDAIRDEGLRPMNRQEVHLAATPEDARAVGRRHADDPALLAVDAAGMVAAGHRVTRRVPGTYTADRVPPAFLAVRDE